MRRSRLISDFVFVDDRGSTHSFRDVLGDYTVLAFTHCDKSAHGPASESLAAMVAENRGVNHMDVRYIDIHWSYARCEQHATCHLVAIGTHGLILCDSTGVIRRLYGIEQEDRLFVIGPDRHVIDSASANDVERLRRQLSLDVEQGTTTQAISKALQCQRDAHGALPPISAEELNSNISELEKRLNRQMVCFAGKNQVYIQSIILGGGKVTKPRIALKCAFRKQLCPPPDVYFEYIRDICCGDPSACPAHQQFRAGQSM